MSVSEAAGNAVFTVTLSAVSGQTVTVAYNTSNGTASAGADYTSASGTLTFAPGTTSQTITVRDTIAPAISGVGPAETIECPAAPVFSNPSATDACDPTAT